jgi:hypothetical protein
MNSDPKIMANTIQLVTSVLMSLRIPSKRKKTTVRYYWSRRHKYCIRSKSKQLVALLVTGRYQQYFWSRHTINTKDLYCTWERRKKKQHIIISSKKNLNVNHAKRCGIIYHMLRTLILYSNHDSGWKVSYSNSTVSCICMLTTRTTRSICINSQLFIL